VPPGPYTFGSTVIGLILLVVLLAYDDRPDYARPDDESYGHSAAYAAAWAFSILLVPGWFLNFVFFEAPTNWASSQTISGSPSILTWHIWSFGSS